MRCLSCDCLLSDFESTRKSRTTNDYIDLCNNCFEDIKDAVDVIEREDLRQNISVEDSEE